MLSMHLWASSCSWVNRNPCIACVNWTTVLVFAKIDRNPWHFLPKVNNEEESKPSCIEYPGYRSVVWLISTGNCSLHSITRLEAGFDKCWMPLVFFGFTNCVLLYDEYTNTRMFVTISICFKQHFDTRYFVFCNLSPPRIFCPPGPSLRISDLKWYHRTPLCHI